jgi:DNA-binding response OmpR family regulator
MTGDLSGKTILVVEDDYLLATDIQRTLISAGAKVCGPFGQIGAAIDALARGDADGALLDINLGHGPSFELASALTERSVPFAFVTGYDSLPAMWRHVPRISKPVSGNELVRLLNEIL